MDISRSVESVQMYSDEILGSATTMANRSNEVMPRTDPEPAMRSVAFPVCLFLNVMLFGMCGYMYLLWLQYWHRLWNQKQQEQPVEYDMSDFRRNEVVVEYFEDPSIPATAHHNKNKRSDDKKSPLAFLHRDMYSGEITSTRLLMLKTKTLAKLRQTVVDESNNMNMDLVNPYGVEPKKNYRILNDNIICDLREKLETVRTLKKSDIEGSNNVQDAIPDIELFNDQNYFNSCAVVTSAGSLYHSNLGEFIDSHDLVLRFNNAPTKGYETDVGSKTTIRIVNSQILAKSEFNFSTSPLYRNISLLVWDPSNYSSSLQQWWNDPEHNFIEPYVQFRRQNPKSNFHILDPSVLWLLWDFIQGHTVSKIRPNPPSSGFLGIALLLPYCGTINVVEYVPTQRAVQRCHYYSAKSDPLCTYGVWHPLAAEKLIALEMNTAPDNTVFYDGYISIPGYNKVIC